MSNTTHINCPHCQTTNRVPLNRLEQHPHCGQCKLDMFMGKPLLLNTKNLQDTLKNNDITVLVDCWAPWCGPCRSFAPIFEQAARELEPKLRLGKLNTDDEQDIARQWQIHSIPTLILFKNNRELLRTSGTMSLSGLKQWLQRASII